MKHKNLSPTSLTQNKWVRFGASVVLAFSLAIVLFLLPVTANSSVRISLPQVAAPLLESGPQAKRAINLPLPFGASLVHATNGLTITKSAPTFIDQGDTLTYTLIVTNETTDHLTQALVADNLPANTTCGTGHSEPASPPAPRWGYTCDNGTAQAGWGMLYHPTVFPISFTAGTSNTLAFSVIVDQPLPDGYEIVNDNYLVDAESATSTFSDTGPAVTTTVRAPNWAITKTVSSDTIQPGQFLTYTIAISNNGSLLTGGTYTVTEVLPNNTSPGSAQIQSPGTRNGITITWVLSDSLAVGQTKTLTYAVQTTSPLTDGETIVNQTYSVTGGNVFSAAVGSPITVTVVSSATLVVVKAASPNPVQAGDLLTYTITVSNDGSSTGPALGVVVSDTLPGEVIYQSAGFAGGASGVVTDTGDPTILWELADPIPVGASALVTVAVRVTSPLVAGPITNTFAASATNASLVSDTLTTQVTSTNSISLSKQVNPAIVAPGDTVTYTITLTNSGNSIATINLSDTLAAGFTPSTVNQAVTLPGRTPFTTESITTVVFAATAPITPGTYYNQAITATYDATQTTVTNVAPVRVVSAVITLTKVANVSTAGVGDTITYTYTITNAGDITLTNITLTDDLLGAIAPLGTTTLSPTGSTTGTATTVVNEADLPGPIVNTAIVTGTYLTSNFVSTTTTESVALTYTTDITIEKVATASAGVPANVGDTITYTYYVTNTGTVTLSNVTLTDDKLGSITVTPSTLAPQQGTPVTATTGVVENDLPGPLVNTATVTGTNLLAESAVATNTASVPLTYTTNITVEKVATVSAGMPADIGDTITYTYYVTNTGTVTLSNVTLTDDKLGSVTVTPNTLAPQQGTPVTATTVVVENNLPGPLVNTATVTGTNLFAESAVATNTASVPLTYTTNITVEKVATASAGVPADIGDTITYTYYVTNTGTVTLSNVTLTDDKLGSITVTPDTLAPQQGTLVTDTTVVVENDLPGPLVNTATVTGTNLLAESAVATNTASVPLTYTIGITVNKIANPTTAIPGDMVNYTYYVTNTGDITLTVDLYDVQLDTHPPITVTLGPKESTTGLAVKTINQGDLPGPLTNLAIVTGTNAIVSDTVIATDTATVALTYTTSISVAKQASVSTATIDDVIVYTYQITNSGNVSLTNISLFDDQLGAITLPVTSLMPGVATTKMVNYTVTQGDFTTFPATSLANTAIVSGTNFNSLTANDTDTVTVTLVYTPQIELAKTANVSQAAPGQSITYTYYVTNTGNVTLTNITLTDDKLGPIAVTTPLTPNGGSTTGTANYSAQLSDIPAITNTATVTGDDILGRPITASQTLAVDVIEALNAITVTNSSPTIFGNTTFFTVTTNLSSSAITYTWNFGDGSAPITIASITTTNYVYPDVGVYTAVVTAFNQINSITGTTTVTITAGPPVKFNLQAISPQTAGTPFTITITALDANDKVADFNGPVTISDDTGTIDPTTVNLVNGTATAFFTVTTATEPNPDTITATSGLISGTVDVVIQAAAPDSLALAVNPLSIRLCETAVATATVLDRFSNPVPNESVTIGEFPNTPAHVNPTSDTGTTGNSGVFTTTFTGIATGTANILAQHASLGFTPATNLNVVGPPVPTGITVTVDPASVIVNNSAVVTAQVSSCVGVASGTVVTFTVPALFGTINPLTATTNASGVATTTVTAGSTPGNTVITGTVEGPLSDTTPFTVLPASAPVLSISKSASPGDGALVLPGQTINYQIVISNGGTASANNLVITDALDTDVGFVTGTLTSGSGPFNSGGVITYSVSSLGVGASVTATLQVTVTTSTSGTIINNSADVASDETTPQTSNGVTHRVVTGTLAAGDVFLPIIMKNSSGPPPCAELQITGLTILPGNVISVTVTNSGGSCATDSNFWVDLYADPDTPPGNLVNITADRRWNSTQVNATHGMAWEVPVLANGASITLTSDGSGGSPTPVDVNWPPSGSVSLYAYADSFDLNDPNNVLYVEVPEIDENNNQFGPVVAAFAAGQATAPPASPTPSPRPDLR